MVSLHRKLFLWLLVPQLVLWVAGGVVTYRLAESYANRAVDASLAQTSRTLLRQLKPIDQGFLIDFPRAAQDVLEADPNDPQMYTVSAPPGSFLLGNSNLPPPPPGEVRKLDTPYFYDGMVEPPDGGKGPRRSMRIVALYVAFGDPLAERQTMLVQVARSSANRQELARAILADTLLPLSILVLLMSVIVWIGIRAGLAPLDKLRRQVERRAPDDLTPLKLELAPIEVRSIATALNDLLAAVHRQLGAQNRFIGDAAHQLRTPLAGLTNQTKIALEKTTDEEMRNRLTLVHQSASRSVRLVSQLLTLARAEPESATALQLAPLDASRAVQELVVQLVPRAMRASVDLGFEAGARDGEAVVLANAILLREAVTNLIDNAIQYAGDGAEVTVFVRRDGSDVLIVVEDNGPGIAPEDRERVFERFVRATFDGNGCGLGLPIVREIVTRHHGTVSLDSAGARGLRATIRLPAADSAPAS